MTDKQNFEKDINVPSKRLDRIDKMEIDLANYEQMERDIEKIIEPYQLDWELDCLSLPSAIQSILERKEQECEELKEQFKLAEPLYQACNIKDKKINKLKQTLTEIKEIAEKIDDSDGCAYGDYDCDNCSSLEQETVCTYKVKKLILQKISEVIPDEKA